MQRGRSVYHRGVLRMLGFRVVAEGKCELLRVSLVELGAILTVPELGHPATSPATDTRDERRGALARLVGVGRDDDLVKAGELPSMTRIDRHAGGATAERADGPVASGEHVDGERVEGPLDDDDRSRKRPGRQMLAEKDVRRGLGARVVLRLAASE